MARLAMSATLVMLGVAGTAAAQPAPASGPNAPPAPKVKVAVVPGVAVNVDPTRVDALTQDMADGLNAELLVEAVGGLEIRRQLRPDLPPDCATQPSCAKEVAAATGAQQILFVTMVDASGGAIQADAMWVDAQTGRSTARPPVSLTTSSDSDAREKFQAAATTLLPDVPVRPKPVKVQYDIGGRVVNGTPRHITTPAILTATATVLGVGAWIGFGLTARSRYATCQDIVAGNQPCSSAARTTIKHLDIGADVGWSVALAGAIATSLIYGLSGESTHLIAAPADSGTGVSLFAIGRF